MSPTPRNALSQALAAQQRTIASLTHRVAVQDLQIAYVARLAGVTKQVTAIRTTADINNPAQPVPDPASQGPSETTEEAATPEAYDDVRNPGMTPGSVGDVPADATDVALAPGTSVPTQPFNDLVDVTAPIAGTEQHIPLDQTRIETDVRVGDPMNLEIAFPWNTGPNNSNGGSTASLNGNRTLASLHLARLQITAGIADSPDDLSVAAAIETSNRSDAQIAAESITLGKVQKAASRNQGRPAGMVPRTASVERTTPSLAPSGPEGLRMTSAVVTDTDAEDLFLND